MTTPYEQAARIYETEPCARPFASDLEAHLFHGMVHSTHECFIMARYVCREWPEEVIRDPWQNPPGETNAIHVYLASGDIGKFFTFDHETVKWISFERANVLRFYEYEPLRRRCLSSNSNTAARERSPKIPPHPLPSPPRQEPLRP